MLSNRTGFTESPETAMSGHQVQSRPMVLLVEDSVSIRRFIAELLIGCGCRVAEAGSGESALALVDVKQPDLVLMDIGLPGISGFDATRAIRERSGDRWLPVIYVTGSTDEQTLSDCFASGGDDFVEKPISKTVLRARVEATLRQLEVYRRQYDERNELAYYREVIDREQEVAHKIFASILNSRRLELPYIKYNLSPMSVFNGDLLLTAGTPAGEVNLLVGDFTGHGLAASIGSLPVAEIFYAMTAKGFDIVDIVAEINRRLHDSLPVGIFLAACGVSIDHTATTARIWGGGLPDILIRRGGGDNLEVLAARHVPIGVLAATDFQRDVDVLGLTAGDRFYIYTDGVVEAVGPAGDQFGAKALQRIVKYTPEDEQVFARIVQRVESFRDGIGQNDDVTLLEYACPESSAATLLRERFNEVRVGRCLAVDWQFTMNLKGAALGEFDPRPVVTQIMLDVCGAPELRSRLYAIVAEMYAVLFEGYVLGMDLTQRQDCGTRSDYNKDLDRRIQSLQTGKIEIKAGHESSAGDGHIRLDMHATAEAQFSAQHSAASVDLRKLSRLCQSVEINPAGDSLTALCGWHTSD